MKNITGPDAQGVQSNSIQDSASLWAQSFYAWTGSKRARPKSLHMSSHMRLDELDREVPCINRGTITESLFHCSSSLLDRRYL